VSRAPLSQLERPRRSRSPSPHLKTSRESRSGPLPNIADTSSPVAYPNSASFTPFAQRTQQLIKEQLGQVEDKTQLPDEYIELEKRVDALKLVHQKLLQVT
jgi:hypothetical protein